MSAQTDAERALADLLVESLNLEDVQPGDIDPEAPLFNAGLGLDSIDALELALAISKRYGFQLRSDNDENRRIFASLRALGVGMGSLRRIVMELSFWVGVVGVAAAIGLTWLLSLFAMSKAVIIALPLPLLIVVGGGLIAIAMLSGFLSMGILKKSQPADLLR